MANRSDRADLVVGIDFGMTCTGVAYTYGPEWSDPKTIQRWPGKLGHEVRNKVDTSISYDLRSGQPTTWGFLCNPDDERYEYNSLFKLYLDPYHKDHGPNPPSTEDARQWYRDYLVFLYSNLMRHFADIIPKFASKSVDFVFSVPVTWRNNPGMVAELEAIIRSAGFGSRGMDSAGIYLTEAEAAAIFASHGSISRGDVFLVCDAGGGTTDLNVLRVESATRGSYELTPLSWTEGAAIGSTLIDFRIRSIIKDRLAAVHDQLKDDIEEVTTQMMQDKFETFKCSFGSPGMDVPRLIMPIPDVPAGLDFPDSCIEDSKLTIARSELQAVFDDQIDKMCTLIDKQLQIVRDRHSAEAVSYLILSGGLGSSRYVQNSIRSRYEKGSGRALAGGDMQVLGSSEPQLAVCHGLVAARMQANMGGMDVFANRCCPVSFGILSRELYDPTRHIGEKVVQDPHDNRRWAEGQINWILKQGQIVRADYGVSERYCIKIAMGREMEPWRTHIVQSSLPAHQLPRSMRHGGASIVCSIETVLHARDMKRKNRHWYNFRDEYNRAEFEIRMIVGTGLRFEIWSADGMIRSRNQDEIAVQWAPPNQEEHNRLTMSPAPAYQPPSPTELPPMSPVMAELDAGDFSWPNVAEAPADLPRYA